MSKVIRHRQSASIPIIPLAIASGVAVASLVAFATYAVRGRSSSFFGPSACKGSSRRRSIALTFDDGPSPGTVPLLEYLARQEVRATFFLCGANMLRHPEIAQAIHAGGHEIGNHTFSHLRLCPRLGWKLNLQSPAKIYREFASTQKILKRSLGVSPTLLRAPYGLRWFGLGAVQRKLRLFGVMWTVIGRDWELDANSIAELVLERSKPGGIICLHDGRDIRPDPDITQTLEAVKLIVPALKREGYQFETVSQLLRPYAAAHST